MTLTEYATGDLVVNEEIFAPVPYTLFDSLMAEYQSTRAKLEHLAKLVQTEGRGVLHYFVEANCPDRRYMLPREVNTLFAIDPAIAKLDAEFWDKTLRLTDIWDWMPTDRRNAWMEQIANPLGIRNRYRQDEWEVEPIPPFEEETVRATIESLLARRSEFLAERVDGIFRALSNEHVTNSPMGFRQRMIIAGLITCYGTTNHDRAGYVNDLRCVIAKFMGRDEPRWDATISVIDFARRSRRGKWVTLDGGALRLRAFKCGTVHLEVHPDMAWRLNAILASLYPTAIPHEMRERPKARKEREYTLIQRPVPFKVLEVLARCRPKRVEESSAEGMSPVKQAWQVEGWCESRSILNELRGILGAIGGAHYRKGNLDGWIFDYDPTEVMNEIICSGVIPDIHSHQFYPTPEDLAREVVAIATADARPGMRWLEPSAGTGNLAGLFPKDAQVDCIEINALHAEILKAKGLSTVVGDFLKMPPQPVYDRIVMNPPFSDGRWQAHLEHATRMLAPGGRLVAILPASAKGKDPGKGLEVRWSEVYEDRFPGTSISVVVATIERATTQ